MAALMVDAMDFVKIDMMEELLVEQMDK